MKYTVFLYQKAEKELRKLEEKDISRIKEALKKLTDDPEKVGERLSGSKHYKIRAGDYRAIYEVLSYEKKVVVLFIGHRSKVYDDFKKLTD